MGESIGKSTATDKSTIDRPTDKPPAQMAAEAYVRKRFSDYYSQAKNIAVNEIEKREFGVGSWDKKIEMRHMNFKSAIELNNYLMNDTPFYISYSAAYYEFPDGRPMEKKNWLGADLVFDIDAEKHKCGKFTCAECFEDVRSRAIRLIDDFLMDDLGFSENEISVNFSGSKGYHVHVIGSAVRSLSGKERKQIADYITGRGLSYNALFRQEGARRKLVGPRPDDGGYRGRFARHVIKQLQDDQEFRRSLHRRLGNPAEAEYYIEGVKEGNWDRINIADREEKFGRVVGALAVKLSDQIDAQVTMDAARLIRLPNSLHGGSSLLAKRISIKELPNFDAMREAVVFTNKGKAIRLKAVEDIPEFSIMGEAFGPYKAGGIIELPEYAGMYLLCKKCAE